MALLDRREVLIQDEIEADEPVEVVWAMLTSAKVEIKGARATLSIGDRRLGMQIIEPAGARFDTMSANPPRPQRQQPHITKLVVRLPSKVSNVRIAVSLAPYPADARPPRPSLRKIEPLDRWIEAAR